MSRIPDTYNYMVGQKFGRLTVLEILDANGGKPRMCKCICECGNEKIKRCNHIINGYTRHCGHRCIVRERISNHRIYGTWSHMKQRCYNKKNPFYRHYGGRGVRVCERWKNSFENFRDDMYQTFKEGLTLDRIDVNGSYCKENCRWADRETQDNNRTDTMWLEINGVKKSVHEWSKTLGITRSILYRRLWEGWSPEETIAPAQKWRKLTESDVVEIKKMILSGVYQHVIAEKFGVARTTILQIKLGKNWKHIKA